MRRSLHATILAVLAMALATPALAQRTTGGISGTVQGRDGWRPARRHRLRQRPQHRRVADGDDQRAGLLPVHRTCRPASTSSSSASPASRRSRGAACASTVGAHDRGERGARGEPAPGERRRRGRVVGRRHHLQRDRLQLRPRVGGQRSAAAQQLLRPGGGGAGLAAGRRLEQRPAHHGLRLLLRRELVPGGRRRHHGQLLQRGARRAERGRDRGGRDPLPRRAGRVREPDRRRLQHRHPPGDERRSTGTRASTSRPTG